MTEHWKDIPGYEGHYQVSDFGRVRSVFRTKQVPGYVTKTGVSKGPSTRNFSGRLLSQGLSGNGYKTVTLGAGNSMAVHRLVAWAFIGPQPDGYDVAHIDGDSHNNVLANLRYDTRSGNCQDWVFHGRTTLSPSQIEFIRVSAAGGKRGIQAKLARDFRVSKSLISQIVSGKSYGHV